MTRFQDHFGRLTGEVEKLKTQHLTDGEAKAISTTNSHKAFSRQHRGAGHREPEHDRGTREGRADRGGERRWGGESYGLASDAERQRVKADAAASVSSLCPVTRYTGPIFQLVTRRLKQVILTLG